MRKESENGGGRRPQFTFCRFEAWMDHSLEGVMQHMSRGVIFLDPFTTQGCFGILPVRQHLENFFKEHLGTFFKNSIFL
jgi:hypothetical protein